MARFCIYIYIYKEREREREGGRDRGYSGVSNSVFRYTIIQPPNDPMMRAPLRSPSSNSHKTFQVTFEYKGSLGLVTGTLVYCDYKEGGLHRNTT